MKNNPISVKYVLYSHYNAFESDDLDQFKNGNKINELKGVQHLESHFRGLMELLTTPGYEGLLVLFYSPGLEDFLEGIAHNDSEKIKNSFGLKFAEDYASFIRKKLEENQLIERVRFITSKDLENILGQVNNIFAEKFKSYIVGPKQGIRYDTPKIVEAIIRLRILGNGVPVLRVDHDVLFRDSNKTLSDLGFFKSVACAVRAYHLRLEEPSVSSFIFSASYNTKALIDRSLVNDSFEAWSRAFATRIYPAILMDKETIKQIIESDSCSKDVLWNQYVIDNLNENIARQYYGLKEINLESDNTNGLTQIGAHPLYSVISGALLCLSEGAIIDLPPFSNFRNNVMWIDDHLKYSLHRAMNHFTSSEALDLEPGLSESRLDNVMVIKARPFISNLPDYTLNIYLPTLLYGTIMDAWITDHPIIKCRFSHLSDKDQTKWRNEKKKQNMALLPHEMLKALQQGNLPIEDEQTLKTSLEKKAIKRINEVRQQWSGLVSENKETFASCWAKGYVKDVIPENYFIPKQIEKVKFTNEICNKLSQNDDKEFIKTCYELNSKQEYFNLKNNLSKKNLQKIYDKLNLVNYKNNGIWEGIAAPNKKPSDIISTIEDLNPYLITEIKNLIDDTINYIKWTHEWPKFIQIIRSFEQGKFRGDISWLEKKHK